MGLSRVNVGLGFGKRQLLVTKCESEQAVVTSGWEKDRELRLGVGPHEWCWRQGRCDGGRRAPDDPARSSQGGALLPPAQWFLPRRALPEGSFWVSPRSEKMLRK